MKCKICDEEKEVNKFFKVNNSPIEKCLSCLFPNYEIQAEKPRRTYKKRTPSIVTESNKIEPTEYPRRKARPIVEYQPASPKEGFVYLLSSSVGLYKIGMAKDVSKRMGDFDRTIPIETKCIHYIKTSDKRQAEKFLHDRFAKYRVKYEWFELSREQVDWICSLVEIDSIIDVRNRSET